MMPKTGSGNDRWDGRLVHSAQGYVARAWRHGDRQRETLDQAERYSTFVRVMKRALPLAALALALAVLGYALQPRDAGKVSMTFERIGTIENDLAMVNPKLTGTDDKGLPFTVTAAQAVQEGRGAERVRLEDIRAELSLEDGTVLNITAAKGVVDTRARQLDISGGIRFVSADGFTAETETAKADLKTGIVSGTVPVTADSKFGRVTAQGFSFEKDTKKLQFRGNVRMLVSGARKK
jgi:lipopolysaccharide export system protein LptC